VPFGAKVLKTGTNYAGFFAANLHHLLRSLRCGEHRIDRTHHLLHALRELLHVLVRGGIRS
jgi:hypothetical protein